MSEYKCYICGKSVTRFGLHWRKYHSIEVSYENYVSKLTLGFDCAPTCPYCDNVRKLSGNGFQKTCGSGECTHRLLSEINLSKWSSAEFRDKQSKSRVESWKNPESRENRITSLKAVMKTEGYRQRMSERVREAYSKNPDLRLKVSEASKSNWQNLEYREKWKTSMCETMSKPETKQHYSNASKLKWQNPEYREVQVQKTIEQWQNDEFRSKMSEVASRTILKTLRNRQGRSDKTSTLYLVWFYDKITNCELVKCGSTSDLGNRLWNLECMGYIPKKVLSFTSSQDKVLMAENTIHSKGFNSRKVDKRFHNMFGNGYTEWYYITEYEPIKEFAETELGVVWKESS